MTPTYGSESSILAGLQQPSSQPGPSAGGSGGIGGLLALFQKHPNLPSSFITGLLGAAGQADTYRQQQAQENRSGFGQMAAQLSSVPGQTPEMLTAQLGAVYPNITEGKYGSNALAGLTEALPGAGGGLDDADKAGLSAEFNKIVAFDENNMPIDDPNTLTSMQSVARRVASLAGKDDAGIQEAVDFANQVYSQIYQKPLSEVQHSLTTGTTTSLSDALKPSNWFFQG